MTDQSGAAIALNAYDEFGAPGAANLGRFQYTGQMWLSEAQLYHYKARAYLPALGRFAQTDPIGLAGGMNLYGYAGNDPVNFIDPWGLEPFGLLPSLPKVVDEITVLGRCKPFACISGQFAIRDFMSQLKDGGGGGIGGFLPIDAGAGSPPPDPNEIVVKASRPRPRFILIQEFTTLPNGPWPGEPGNVCVYAYFECVGAMEREQFFHDDAGRIPNKPLRAESCRASMSICVSEARRLYSTPGFGRSTVLFPYGSGRVLMRADPNWYFEQFIPGPGAPANSRGTPDGAGPRKLGRRP